MMNGRSGTPTPRLSLLLIAILLVGVTSLINKQYITRIRKASSLRLLSTLSRDVAVTTNVAVKSKICIIGGGFGGLYTALKLSELTIGSDDIEITLIDPKDKFVFLPLLYELAMGAASVVEVSPRYETLLKGSKVKFIQSAVSEINLRKNEIKLFDSGSDPIKYDQVVISVGAQPRLDLVNGAKEYAMPFYRVEDAYELKLRLRALLNSGKETIRAVILGGGYSGVEVATSIAAYLGKNKAEISIIDRSERIMKSSAEKNRERAEESISSLGVKSYLQTSANKVSRTAVHCRDLSNKEFEIPADIVIFTTGMEQSSLIKKIQLQKDRYGRIATTRAMQCKSRPNVFALGDCSGINNEFVPSTAQVALQQSEIVAKNLLYRIDNYEKEDLTERTSRPDELDKFRFVPLGEMLTLGAADGALNSLNGLVHLTGPFAAISRRLVYAARMPTREQQVTALFSTGMSAFAKARNMALNPFLNSFYDKE